MMTLMLGAVLLTQIQAGSFPEGDRIASASFADNGAALENPGMGWVLHFYDDGPGSYGSQLAPDDTVDDYPGLTTVYFRLPWSFIEPEEGHFNWSIIDSPAQRWIAKGKKIALCFPCSESWLRYATPEWVKNAGAKGYDFESGPGITKGGKYWEPNFDDRIFLKKLEAFLRAAAERYDGNPDVAFLDVGSFGVWGEGHTFWSTKKVYPAQTVHRHIDLNRRCFPNTLLVANDDYAVEGRGARIIQYASKQGLSLRDNSIMVDKGARAFFSHGLAQMFWPKVPVILESEHYGLAKERDNWGDGNKYLDAVEAYHASYVAIHWWPREFLEANRDLVQKINLRLGYRIQILDATWSREIPLNKPISFSARWRNAGVAPCLPGGYPAFTLKDAKGGIVGVFTDGRFDVRNLPVGAPGKAEIVKEELTASLPFNLKPGEYEVFVSMGSKNGTPKIALPLDGNDGQRRYRVGSIQIVSN